MRRRIDGSLLVGVVIVLVGFFLPVVSATAPMRAVILFDNSGSMRKNDPERLSRTAAQLFLDLAQSHDQVALVAFSDTGVSLLPLTRIDSPQVLRPFREHLHALRFNGRTTDLGAALEAGLQSLPERQDDSSRDVVLLLTDGKLDLGKHRRAAEPLALEYIRETLLPQYRARGVTLYTIAFTEAADRVLLQEMAQQTAGEFRFIPNGKVLHTAFSELFIAATQAESIPMKDGAVQMDASINEASLVLSKRQAQEPLGLVTPQQQRLTAGHTAPGVQWRATPAYDMIHLKKPEPGTWQVDRPLGPGEDLAIIADSTLRLEVELDPGFLEIGEAFTLRARLLENDQPLRDAQRLHGLAVTAVLTASDGHSATLPLMPQEPGRFAGTYTAPTVPGAYQLIVTATSPTMQRQRSLSVRLYPHCLQPAVLAEPPVTVQLTLQEACPAFARLEFAAAYVTGADGTPAKDAWVSLTSPQPRVFHAVFPRPRPGENHVVFRLYGGLSPTQTFTLQRGPLPIPTLPPPAIDWLTLSTTVGMQLLVVNIVLGLVGGGYGFYRTRMRRVTHGE